MKKFILSSLILLLLNLPANAWDFNGFKKNCVDVKETIAVKNLLKSQVRYANKNNFEKFIATYDEKYVNGDGFNLDIYSTMIKDLWALYGGIEYAVEFKNVDINGDEAEVELIETSYANLDVNEAYDGELKSVANSVYNLRKSNGKWRVVSDRVIDETTSMLYGEAKDLDVKLFVPNEIEPGVDYVATLEFEPPEETYAIASIAADKVEYPQQPTKEVFRVLPEDNILERIFTSNNDNVNEYIVASIGLTKASITDASLKLSLTGFGYTIKRVNVVEKAISKEQMKDENVKNK